MTHVWMWKDVYYTAKSSLCIGDLSAFLQKGRDDGKHKQRRGENVRHINRPSLRERQDRRAAGEKTQERRARDESTRLLHERWHSGEADAAQGSTVRGQDEGKEQLSARAGSDSSAPTPLLQLSDPGEMANSHTGHWVSVQGLMGHRNLSRIYRKVCVLEAYSRGTHTNAHLIGKTVIFTTVKSMLCIIIYTE